MKQVILSFLLLVTMAFSQAYAEQQERIYYYYIDVPTINMDELTNEELKELLMSHKVDMAYRAFDHMIMNETDEHVLTSLFIDATQDRVKIRKDYVISFIVKKGVYNETIRDRLVTFLNNDNVSSDAFWALVILAKEDPEFLEEVFFKVLTGNTKISRTKVYKQIKETGIYSERIKQFLLTEEVPRYLGPDTFDILTMFESDKEEFLIDAISQMHYRVNYDIRKRAIRYLSDQGVYSKKVKEALLYALDSDNYHIIRCAIDSLIKHEPDKVFVSSLLLKKTESDNGDIRRKAVSSFQDVGVYNETIKDRLITLLEHPDDTTVRFALHSLLALETDTILLTTLLTPRLRHKDVGVSMLAMHNIGKLGVYNEEIKKALVLNLKHNKEDHVISSAMVILLKLESDHKFLEELFRTAPSITSSRSFALSFLTQLRRNKVYNQIVKDIILEAFTMEQRVIIISATNTLADLEPDKAITIKILQDQLEQLNPISTSASHVKDVIENGGYKIERLGELIFH